MTTAGSVTWATMGESEDWVMRPVLEGVCKYESLIDGTLGLEDVRRMNDALDVKNTNEILFQEANRGK